MADGVLLLDKPLGLSSNAALQRAKRALKAKKAGHAGTLDPLASGLLLILVGEATKFAGPLLEADKEYLATLKLGERTSTGDAEGEVLERIGVPAGVEQRLAAVLAGFIGEIEQVPPMYSALKHKGVPLYKHARRGESIDRPSRRVRILELQCHRVEEPFLDLRIRCSKGTYIRTLAEDIGHALGTTAHLTALRRTRSGGFSVAQAVPLAALEEMGDQAGREPLVPLARLLAELPRAQLDGPSETRFRNGQALAYPLGEGLCGVYGADGGVIGIGRADAAGRLHPVRLVASLAASG
jgi:tRNA pseudouridine55 synthase